MYFRLIILVQMLLITQLANAELFHGVAFPGGEDSFADEVIVYDNKIKNGEPGPMQSQPGQSLGAPNYSASISCASAGVCSYVSLGLAGTLTVRFDNFLTGSGNSSPDLWVFEIGPDVEDTFVEVSKDGSTFFSVGKIGGATSGVDLDAFGYGLEDMFSYVRLTDDPNEGNTTGISVGADIDSIGAISTIQSKNCSLVIEQSSVTTTTTTTIPGEVTGDVYCDHDDPDSPIDELISLTFEYTGSGCPVNYNDQNYCGGAYCDGSLSEMLEPVSVEVLSGKHNCLWRGGCDIYDANPDSGLDILSGIMLGEHFTVTVKPDTQPLHFAPKTKVILSNDGGKETNYIHTSCSQRLAVGDIFGSLTLVAINEEHGTTGTDGDTTTTSEETTYSYVVTNNGDDVLNAQVFDSVFLEVGAPFDLVNGASVTVTHSTDASAVSSISSVIADLDPGIQNCSDTTAPPDTDGDGVLDSDDNCPVVANADQADYNNDGLGDRCDAEIDQDLDGVLNSFDNCPTKPNGNQADIDEDGIGDACDTSFEKPLGCNANSGNYDLLLILLLIVAFSYVRDARLARKV